LAASSSSRAATRTCSVSNRRNKSALAETICSFGSASVRPWNGGFKNSLHSLLLELSATQISSTNPAPVILKLCPVEQAENASLQLKSSLPPAGPGGGKFFVMNASALIRVAFAVLLD
jgi:hypothetical protein